MLGRQAQRNSVGSSPPFAIIASIMRPTTSHSLTPGRATSRHVASIRSPSRAALCEHLRVSSSLLIDAEDLHHVLEVDDLGLRHEFGDLHVATVRHPAVGIERTGEPVHADCAPWSSFEFGKPPDDRCPPMSHCVARTSATQF